MAVLTDEERWRLMGLIRPDANPTMIYTNTANVAPSFTFTNASMSAALLDLTLTERDLPKSSKEVVGERDRNGLHRVRVQRVKAAKGHIGGSPLSVTEIHYLDGGGWRFAATDDEPESRPWFHAEEMRADMAYIVPARTKQTVDFGRLAMASKSLAVQMVACPNPDPAQLAIFINGYNNLKEWRRVVRAQMVEAEGQIGAVETMLRQMVD